MSLKVPSHPNQSTPASLLRAILAGQRQAQPALAAGKGRLRAHAVPREVLMMAHFSLRSQVVSLAPRKHPTKGILYLQTLHCRASTAAGREEGRNSGSVLQSRRGGTPEMGGPQRRCGAHQGRDQGSPSLTEQEPNDAPLHLPTPMHRARVKPTKSTFIVGEGMDPALPAQRYLWMRMARVLC